MFYMYRSYTYYVLGMLFSVFATYSMQDFAVEVYNRYKAEDFVRTYPHMTLPQAQIKLGSCSELVQKKIWDKVQAKYKTDQTFAVVFDMTTKLPVEASKRVVLKLLHDNEKAAEKFMHMPIGRALEWHAEMERAAYGKMILLSPFKQKVFMLFKDEKKDRKKINDDDLLRPCDGDEWFRVDQGYVRIVLDKKSKKSISAFWRRDFTDGFSTVAIVAPEQFALHVEDVKSQLFQLTMQDIILLLKNDDHYTRKELEQLVAIDKNVPFLADCNKSASYNFRKSYSLAHIYEYCTGTGYRNEDFKEVSSLVNIPIGVALLPQFVARYFCTKVALEYLVAENEKIKLLNQLIQASGNVDLLQYCKPLVDVFAYTDWDMAKMGASLCGGSFLAGCLLYKNFERDKLLRSVLTGGAVFFSSFLLTNILDEYALIGGGLAWTVFSFFISRDNEFFRFRRSDESKAYKKLPALLQRTDIDIK